LVAALTTRFGQGGEVVAKNRHRGCRFAKGTRQQGAQRTDEGRGAVAAATRGRTRMTDPCAPAREETASRNTPRRTESQAPGASITMSAARINLKESGGLAADRISKTHGALESAREAAHPLPRSAQRAAPGHHDDDTQNQRVGLRSARAREGSP
jgi:hypothetical protein